MKRIIDIPDEVIEAFKKADDINFSYYDYNSLIGKAIRNSTPLNEVEAENIQKYINALRKCAKEHEKEFVPTFNIRTSDLCNDTADLLEKLIVYPKSDKSVLEDIKAELIQDIQNGVIKISEGNEGLFSVIDKHISGKE